MPRFYLLLINPSFWLDEAFLYKMSTTPLWDLIRGNYWDFHSHPFLAHLIMKLMSIVSLDERWLRLPYIVTSLFSILGLYYLSLKIFKQKKIALISAYIFASSTYNIRFAIEAKYYSLILFFEILSLIYFIYMVDNFKSSDFYKKIILFVTFSFLALMTDYSFFWLYISYMVFTALFILINKNLNELNKILFMLSLLSVFLLFKPWFPKFIFSLPTALTIRRPLGIPNAYDLLTTNLTYLTFYKHPPPTSVPETGWYESFRELTGLDEYWAMILYNFTNYCLLILVSLSLCRFVINITKQKLLSHNLLIPLIIILPLLLSFLFSQKYPIYIHYNLMIAQIGLILLLGKYIYEYKRIGLVMLFLYVILNILSFNTLRKYLTVDDLRSVYTYIDSRNLPEKSTLLFYPHYYDVVFDYYGALKTERSNFTIQELNYTNLLQSSRNLCLIYYSSSLTDIDNRIDNFLNNYFSLTSHTNITPGPSISCYIRKLS